MPAVGRFQPRILFAAFTGIVVAFISLPSVAGTPDRETWEYITHRYHLLLEETRDSCGYYANPNTLSKLEGGVRGLSVLLMHSQRGGSMCQGVFQFQEMTVKCQTGEVAYADRRGSPANWGTLEFQRKPEVARKVCTLP
ncbi:MAG: hypothetical protein ACM37W_26555 [Actinomycetota bacterium]